jgi:Uma2 family endonuclease
MSPAPARSHQRILGELFRRIADITDTGPCETYLAPFDIRLQDDPAGIDTDETTTTVVQPDISVFGNPEILDERGARSAPDLVVEILSPATSYKDQTHKLALYERHRVREYWIVNGEARWVMVYRLGEDNRYGKPDYYRAGQEKEVIVSAVLGGAEIGTDSFL